MVGRTSLSYLAQGQEEAVQYRWRRRLRLLELQMQSNYEITKCRGMYMYAHLKTLTQQVYLCKDISP